MPAVGSAETPEELEKRRRERRMTRMPVNEEEEALGAPLKTGNIVSSRSARQSMKPNDGSIHSS